MRTGWADPATDTHADAGAATDTHADAAADAGSGTGSAGTVAAAAGGPHGGGTVLLRIGDAAAAAGTTPRALRFYEQRGLLPTPARTASGQRQYGPADVARVRIIRDLLAAGFTVADLRGLAPRMHLLLDGEPMPVCVPEPGGVVALRLAALDAEIDRLTRLRARLTHLLAGGPPPGARS